MSSIITLPQSIKANEEFNVQILVSHHMETGFRRDIQAKIIPRDIITRLDVLFNTQLYFAMEFTPAIAANPFISFPLKLPTSGVLDFIFTGDNGFSLKETRKMSVI